MSRPRTGLPSDNSEAPAFSSARAGAPTASDYSKPNTGALRGVVNESAHGEEMATRRYGYGTQHPDIRSGDETGEAPQRAGDANNLQERNYKNDTSGWVRAEGETAENRPGFVKGYRAKDGEPGARGGPPLRPTDKGPHSTEPVSRPYKPTVPPMLKD